MRSAKLASVIYAVFAVWVGLGWLVTPIETSLSSPAVHTADQIFPIEAWGGMFMVLGTFLAIGLMAGNEVVYSMALSLVIAWLIAWTGAVIYAVYQGKTSLGAPAWPALALVIAIALLGVLRTGRPA